jgi:hypothetical protein
MLYSSFMSVYVATSTQPNAGSIVFPNFVNALHRPLTIKLEPEPSWLGLSWCLLCLTNENENQRSLAYA